MAKVHVTSRINGQSQELAVDLIVAGHADE